MDKDKDQDNKRGKLTLKLRLPTSSDPKTLALKNAESKRISNSMVQVTIKGRKKDNKPAIEPKQDPRGLSKNEFEARKLALGNFDNKNNEALKEDYEVNSKLKSLSILAKPIVKEVEEEQIPEEINIEQENEQVIEKEVAAPIEAAAISFDVDHFDVHNKIKNSLAVENRQKVEREKLLEERRKVEKERLEKEKEKKNKSKKPTKDEAFEDEFEKNKKNKVVDVKSTKINSRRLLQTFIIDEDGGEGFGRYRKKQKIKQIEEAKEHQKITHEVILPALISVSELADRMAEKTGDVVKKLFSMGFVATSNQVIDADTAELIVAEFGHTVKRVLESDVENILNTEEDPNVEQLDRAPIVTIMGHVDHGKTSLLDAIKSTDVVSGESGGITQHIGASRIQTNSGKYITFLDTPGHEAFTEMRSRGANVTDIVVLVVAADDGVKEQTVEAINHAKAAGVPIIVAVNKIDKPGADASKVKNELLNYEIIAEELSGDTMFVEVSAKQKINLDKLEEAILLQAEILELKAPYNTKAQGVVIETRIDPSKGVVTTLLIQKGTLNISDIVVAGTSYGRVKKMSDDKGKNIKTAFPSMPVEILGLDFAPDAGDPFSVISEEKQARDIISYRSKKQRDDKSLKNSARSVSDIFRETGKGRIKYLPLIVKGDVHGSVEAICSSLLKLNTDEVAIKIIHSATGGISETDVSLASVAGAIIIGFNVRANVASKDLARLKKVDIRYHSIIYNIVDELKLLLGGMLEPIKNEESFGQAEIRQVFKVSGSGKIAGCFVTSGMIKRGAKVRLLRDNIVVYEGSLRTLKRFKDDVKEAKQGFECGVAFENFDDMKEGDIIECYEIVEKKRTL
jgi:translation initiation factor IF-2